MIVEKLIADVEARAGVTKAFQMILAASLATNVFMAGAFLTMDRTVRTVLVPPEVTKTFWVDGRSIGPEYLEQMGSWVVSQYATVSPSTIDYQNATLLKYVHPSVHGELSVRFKMGANRLKAENMSKIFMPREVRVSEKGQGVAFIGNQVTFIADKRVPADELKAYLVMFDYDGSRVYIKEMRETSPTRPFDPPAAVANQNSDQGYQAPAGATNAPSPVPQQFPVGSPTSNDSSLPPAPKGNAPANTDALQSGNAPTTPASR